MNSHLDSAQVDSSAKPGVDSSELSGADRRLALLLAAAMFVLVVDTSLMNVSISAVVGDIGTTVSTVQATIAREALISASVILINSDARSLALQFALVAPLLAGQAGLALSVKMIRLPDIEAASERPSVMGA